MDASLHLAFWLGKETQTSFTNKKFLSIFCFHFLTEPIRQCVGMGMTNLAFHR